MLKHGKHCSTSIRKFENDANNFHHQNIRLSMLTVIVREMDWAL